MKEAWKLIQPEDLYYCYECSRCTGSCPAAMVMDTPGPRRFLVKCLHGGVSEVILDKSLWYCTTCHVCEDRCPQELHIMDLLTGLMNMAAARGNLPEKIKEGVEMIINTGRSVSTYKVDERRARFGLKPLGKIDTTQIEAIAARTGLLEKLKS